ncbi:hypothetical protein [Rufibacter quisquiliarum]|uniref:Oxidase n=1 Tax=Rufibacter quisquiliarum TaxID=1549639 RepID=A0A839GH00_9BACT|nr:hypothetical protein [Rufibacter quisquiliarum]MBA9078934.1 hypothetical protein [Rufibacter quisquiliarum]
MVGDLLLTEDGDLRVENGDLVIGDSQEQHIKLVTLSAPGFWKDTPLLGPDLAGFLLDETNLSELQQAIQKHLELDGCKGVSFEFNDNGQFKAKGYYE